MARSSDQSTLIDEGSDTTYSVTPTNAIGQNALSAWTFSLLYDPAGRWTSTTASNSGIFGNWDAVTGENILLRIADDDGNLQMYFRNAADLQYGAATGTLAGLNTWSGIVGRWDGSDIVLFVDGTKGSDVSATGSWTAASEVLRLGFMSGSQSSPGGYFQHFAWFERGLSDQACVDLSLMKVNPLMHAPTNYWPLDGTAVDLVGGNPMVLGAGASFSTVSVPPPPPALGGVILPFAAPAAGAPAGTAVSTLPGVAADASGGQSTSGPAAQALPSVQQSATAEQITAAIAAQILPALRQGASGTTAGPELGAGVAFDGADFLTRSGLTGASNGRKGTLSFLYRPDTAPGTLEALYGFSVNISRQATGALRIRANGTASADRLDISSSITLEQDQWYAVSAAWDLAPGAGDVRLYINDVDVLSVTANATDEDLDYTRANDNVGASDNSGSNKMSGCLAEFYFSQAAYLDLDTESQRRKFFDAGGNPVDKGPAGATPTGATPIVYLSGGAGQFADNFGSGGAFTVSGSLAECAVPTFHAAAAAQALPALEQLASASQGGSATAAQALPALEQGAAGVQTISAAGAQTLPGLNQAASGAHVAGGAAEGSAAQTLRAATQIANGLAAAVVAAAQALPTLEQAASGAQGFAAIAAQGVPTLEQAASGGSAFIATAALAFPTLEQAASALQAHTASGAQILANVTQAGAGFAAVDTVGGSATQTLPAFTAVSVIAIQVPDTALGFLDYVSQDLDVFFEIGDGFAVLAAHAQAGAFKGILDDEASTEAGGEAEMASLLCKAADVVDVHKGHTVTIAGAAYQVAGRLPDGVGLTRLLFHR